MTNFHAAEWFRQFAIGLPIVAVVAWLRWKQTRISLLWRWCFCAILASITTPLIVSDEQTDVDPAFQSLIQVLIEFIHADIKQRQQIGHSFYVLSLYVGVSIFLVSLVLFAIWSLMIFTNRRRRRNTASMSDSN